MMQNTVYSQLLITHIVLLEIKRVAYQNQGIKDGLRVEMQKVGTWFRNGSTPSSFLYHHFQWSWATERNVLYTISNKRVTSPLPPALNHLLILPRIVPISPSSKKIQKTVKVCYSRMARQLISLSLVSHTHCIQASLGQKTITATAAMFATRNCQTSTQGWIIKGQPTFKYAQIKLM